MESKAVGGMSDWSGLLKDFFRQIHDGTLTREMLGHIVNHRAVYPSNEVSPDGDWIKPFCRRNCESLISFGITDFDHALPVLRAKLEEIGPEQIASWQKLMLEPVYWPTISLGPADNYVGWKKKPEEWYFRIAREGKIRWRDKIGELDRSEEPCRIQAGVYLVDTRLKPLYDNGRQMWTRDGKFLGKLIRKLRREKKIFAPDGTSPATRFYLSANEAEQYLIPLLACQKIYKGVKQWRSERVSEFNFISQCFSWMPRSRDGETNTLIWFDDCFKDSGWRLDGGYSDHGGLADVVYFDDADYHWYYRSFRPLAVL
jgi:hypothetical protein